MPPMGERAYLALRKVFEAVKAGDFEPRPMEQRALQVIFELANARQDLTTRQIQIIHAIYERMVTKGRTK